VLAEQTSILSRDTLPQLSVFVSATRALHAKVLPLVEGRNSSVDFKKSKKNESLFLRENIVCSFPIIHYLIIHYKSGQSAQNGVTSLMQRLEGTNELPRMVRI